MYEKQGTPPCGAFNTYIWNKCIGEIAGTVFLCRVVGWLMDSKVMRKWRKVNGEKLFNWRNWLILEKKRIAS
nr:MAG TPA: hypothetical protein [Caudoviricetes sp.]